MGAWPCISCSAAHLVSVLLSLSLYSPASRLPKYSCQFIEMCLMVTADHGPAVSGAHNTIICARAGKDLVSSLTSGLLTIVSIVFPGGARQGHGALGPCCLAIAGPTRSPGR